MKNVSKYSPFPVSRGTRDTTGGTPVPPEKFVSARLVPTRRGLRSSSTQPSLSISPSAVTGGPVSPLLRGDGRRGAPSLPVWKSARTNPLPAETSNCPVNLPTSALVVIDRIWRASGKFVSRNHFLLSALAAGTAAFCRSSAGEFEKICRDYGRPIACASVAACLLLALGLAEVRNAKHYERGFRSVRRSMTRTRDGGLFQEV